MKRKTNKRNSSPEMQKNQTTEKQAKNHSKQRLEDNNRAPGDERVATKIIELGITILAFFNLCLSNQNIPTSWNYSRHHSIQNKIKQTWKTGDKLALSILQFMPVYPQYLVSHYITPYRREINPTWKYIDYLVNHLYK